MKEGSNERRKQAGALPGCSGARNREEMVVMFVRGSMLVCEGKKKTTTRQRGGVMEWRAR